ncbi:hypothetical protein GJ496_011345 [Pomphorhynchus laevis]|nr:hypothetical protein GJ496_011345 [Pomphorhynchus laevis]
MLSWLFFIFSLLGLFNINVVDCRKYVKVPCIRGKSTILDTGHRFLYNLTYVWIFRYRFVIFQLQDSQTSKTTPIECGLAPIRHLISFGLRPFGPVINNAINIDSVRPDMTGLWTSYFYDHKQKNHVIQFTRYDFDLVVMDEMILVSQNMGYFKLAIECTACHYYDINIIESVDYDLRINTVLSQVRSHTYSANISSTTSKMCIYLNAIAFKSSNNFIMCQLVTISEHGEEEILQEKRLKV